MFKLFNFLLTGFLHFHTYGIQIRLDAVIKRLVANKDNLSVVSLFAWGRMTFTIKDGDLSRVLWKPKRVEALAIFAHLYLNRAEIFATLAPGYEFVFEDASSFRTTVGITIPTSDASDFFGLQKELDLNWGVHKRKMCPALRQPSVLRRPLSPTMLTKDGPSPPSQQQQQQGQLLPSQNSPTAQTSLIPKATNKHAPVKKIARTTSPQKQQQQQQPINANFATTAPAPHVMQRLHTYNDPSSMSYGYTYGHQQRAVSPDTDHSYNTFSSGTATPSPIPTNMDNIQQEEDTESAAAAALLMFATGRQDTMAVVHTQQQQQSLTFKRSDSNHSSPMMLMSPSVTFVDSHYYRFHPYRSRSAPDNNHTAASIAPNPSVMNNTFTRSIDMFETASNPRSSGDLSSFSTTNSMPWRPW